VWGVRPAAHIHLRNRGKPEGPRYEAIPERGGMLGMFRVYLTWAVIMVVVSTGPAWSPWWGRS
jgi:steroid 5-alpha reductase family enzyme